MFEFLIRFARGAGLFVQAASKNQAWAKAMQMGIPDEDIIDVEFVRTL